MASRRPCPRNSIGSRQDVDTTSDEISRTMIPKTSRWMDGIISPRGLRDHVLVVMAIARAIQGGRGLGAVARSSVAQSIETMVLIGVTGEVDT